MHLAPHLHRIGNDLVAAYLIVADDGITVVDAGLPGHWSDLQRELRAMNRTPEDIRGVVLTHGDADHIGFAERLRATHGVPVYVHSGDADRARGGNKPKTPAGPMKLGPTIGFALYSLRKRAFPVRSLTEVVEVEDGATLDLPGAPRIIHLPGHSPGSIAVYSELADAVFVGDALTTRHVLLGNEGAQPAPFTDDPAQALRSLERIESLSASWILPGHGAPLRGTPADVIAAVVAAA